MIWNIRNLGWFWFLSLFLAPLLTGCEAPVTSSVTAGDSTVVVTDSKISTPVANAVCNPLGGENPLGGNYGLQADLYYLDPSLPHFSNVDDYIQQGTKLDAHLFFDQVNVPTRPFDAGFVTTEGTVLTTPSGDTLYEWFALDFFTTLKLTNADPTGDVQFALLSDDGAVLSQKIGGSWQTLVDNDGQHSTELKVASSPVTLDGQSALPLRLQYFQGPRFHIAAILLWRPWPTNGHWQDPLDGQMGNGLYFDSTHSPSVPQQSYNDLLARGWKPVPAANFFLPETVAVNPCPPPATSTDTNTNTSTATSTGTSTDTSTGVLAIQGFDGTTTNNSASMIWQTTVPASGKMHWGLAADQLTQVVDENNGDQTTHVVLVTGLNGATQYFFQAESTDSGGNTILSAVVHKTTK